MLQAPPNIEWQVEAVNRIDRLLKSVTAALDAAEIPYAVIGGNAVSTWVATRDVGAVRATMDVDLLMQRSDVDRTTETLASLNLIRHDVLELLVFMEANDPRPSQGVHVIMANEKVRAYSNRPAPDVSRAVRVSSGFLVLDLVSLVIMKLEAYRRVDQVHIEDMLRVGLIDEQLVAELLDELCDRLRHIRDTMEWNTDPPQF